NVKIAAACIALLAATSVINAAADPARAATGAAHYLYATNWLTNDVSVLRLNRNGVPVAPASLSPALGRSTSPTTMAAPAQGCSAPSPSAGQVGCGPSDLLSPPEATEQKPLRPTPAANTYTLPTSTPAGREASPSLSCLQPSHRSSSPLPSRPAGKNP